MTSRASHACRPTAIDCASTLLSTRPACGGIVNDERALRAVATASWPATCSVEKHGSQTTPPACSEAREGFLQRRRLDALRHPRCVTWRSRTIGARVAMRSQRLRTWGRVLRGYTQGGRRLEGRGCDGREIRRRGRLAQGAPTRCAHHIWAAPSPTGLGGPTLSVVLTRRGARGTLQTSECWTCKPMEESHGFVPPSARSALRSQ
jgi:hypothetical protein